jgi:hypothetical protein
VTNANSELEKYYHPSYSVPQIAEYLTETEAPATPSMQNLRQQKRLHMFGYTTALSPSISLKAKMKVFQYQTI